MAMRKGIYTKDHQGIVRKLVMARLSAGLTQEQVARKLGCTQSYVSKIENGQVEISVMLLKKLARVYAIGVGDFL